MPVAEAPAAVPGEPTIESVFAGQASTCDLLHFDKVGDVFNSSYESRSQRHGLGDLLE